MTIVTIDGPAGSGKSTVSRLVAQRLGYTYLDTGAMYRAVGLLAQEEGVDLEDEGQLGDLLADLELVMGPGDGEYVQVIINGRDVSRAIRSAEMGMVASRISALAQVRAKLTQLQQELGRHGDLVAEGRDMGTVVFPHAPHKFFVAATAQERARRRAEQLRAKGEVVDEKELLAQIEKRDHDDANRALAPLRPAEDAITIDSSRIDAQGVVNLILAYLAKK
ncbi:MAG: (d)CMP kinase [Thermodesulfobacteriota bacterium]